mmetsp:Transcript_18131/g.41459  ORF Transcript_18131/g.41459 Transcript_18131/m.41459 type:complete len:304 (-) Transcript_18131:1463-2374(-)
MGRGRCSHFGRHVRVPHHHRAWSLQPGPLLGLDGQELRVHVRCPGGVQRRRRRATFAGDDRTPSNATAAARRGELGGPQRPERKLCGRKVLRYVLRGLRVVRRGPLQGGGEGARVRGLRPGLLRGRQRVDFVLGLRRIGGLRGRGQRVRFSVRGGDLHEWERVPAVRRGALLARRLRRVPELLGRDLLDLGRLLGVHRVRRGEVLEHLGSGVPGHLRQLPKRNFLGHRGGHRVRRVPPRGLLEHDGRHGVRELRGGNLVDQGRGESRMPQQLPARLVRRGRGDGLRRVRRGPVRGLEPLRGVH